VSDRNQLLPGGLYKLNPLGGTFKNRAEPTGQWNKLEIVFCPPKPDAKAPTDPAKASAAQIEVKLNGATVYLGPILGADGMPAKGTGGRFEQGRDKDLEYIESGPIYLQSHWGSQVEFRDPFIQALEKCPFEKK
jgi:hypothetical protein